MTHVSALLLGLLAVAAVVMSYGAFMTLRHQIKAGDTWSTSPAMQLSVAIFIHGFSAIPVFLSTLLAPDKPQVNIVMILLWAGWSGWFIAKTLVIKITGYLEAAMWLYTLWLILWFYWRFM